jgi:hypothetical protein
VERNLLDALNSHQGTQQVISRLTARPVQHVEHQESREQRVRAPPPPPRANNIRSRTEAKPVVASATGSTKGTCSDARTCRTGYKHLCDVCGSPKHGSYACPRGPGATSTAPPPVKGGKGDKGDKAGKKHRGKRGVKDITSYAM